MHRRCAVILCASLLLPAILAGDAPPPSSAVQATVGEVGPQTVVAFCFRAAAKMWYSPGRVWVWSCYRAPDTDDDGCYEWENAQSCLVWDGEYTITESCLECECSDPCFSDPDNAEAAAPESGEAGFQLDRPMSKDAGIAEFRFPREANRHIVVWPEEVPGFVVRIEKDDQTWWDVKLFPVAAVTNWEGPGGDPEQSRVETFRFGFQIERLASDEQPMFTTSLGALQPARDGRRDFAFDGLYELRLGKETFYVRMSDDPR